MTAKVIRSWLARLRIRTLYIEPGMRQLCLANTVSIVKPTISSVPTMQRLTSVGPRLLLSIWA